MATTELTLANRNENQTDIDAKNWVKRIPFSRFLRTAFGGVPNTAWPHSTVENPVVKPDGRVPEHPNI